MSWSGERTVEGVAAAHAAKVAACAVALPRLLPDLFDVLHRPRLVEERFLRAVEAEHDLERAARFRRSGWEVAGRLAYGPRSTMPRRASRSKPRIDHVPAGGKNDHAGDAVSDSLGHWRRGWDSKPRWLATRRLIEKPAPRTRVATHRSSRRGRRAGLIHLLLRA